MVGIAEKFGNLERLMQQKNKWRQEIANLDMAITDIREELKRDIPPGETVEGISHLTFEHREIAYSDVLKAVIREVIPPAKQPRAWSILERMTKWVMNHSFERAPALPGA